jgi:hypothetical protein
LRMVREVYWLDAIANTMKTIENITPTTVSIEPTRVDIIPWYPFSPSRNTS